MSNVRRWINTTLFAIIAITLIIGVFLLVAGVICPKYEVIQEYVPKGRATEHMAIMGAQGWEYFDWSSADKGTYLRYRRRILFN